LLEKQQFVVLCSMIWKNTALRWRALWNPPMYHGWGKTRRYFEGWYNKIVSPDGDLAFAIIPGISMEANGRQHAFIQVLDGKRCTASYHEFPADAFQPDTHDFGLTLGPNRFSREQIVLDLPKLKGTLQFSGHHPWPSMLGAPGIMGWYSFMPFMECYHGVLSMHHRIEGSLQVYDQKREFSGGFGYMEKDWGQSFPACWIWMQSNHFGTDTPCSLMASVARIPWLGTHFNGYIVGWLWEGTLYRFATYTGAQIMAHQDGQELFVAFRDRTHRLEIHAHQAGGADLVSPISGTMTGKVNESMQSELEVRFYKGNALLFEGRGHHAGLEVAGPVETLYTSSWKR
jgi:tocopherol cyclase